FGFAFIASAIWIATPLLPIGIDMLLWGILLLAVAAFFLSEAWKTINGKIAARTTGAAAAIYGACLIIGFASDGTDPLKPLMHIGSSSTQTAALQFDQAASMDELTAKLSKADKPAVVYFTADWCTTCYTI